MATPHGAPRRWRDRGALAAVSVSIVVGLVDGPAAVLGSFLAIARGAPRRPAAVPTRRARGDDRHCVRLHAGGVPIGRSWSGRAGRRLHRCVRASDRRRSLLATGAATASMALIVSVSGAHIETIVANGIAFWWWRGSSAIACAPRGLEPRKPSTHGRGDARSGEGRAAADRPRAPRRRSCAQRDRRTERHRAPRPRQLAGDGLRAPCHRDHEPNGARGDAQAPHRPSRTTTGPNPWVRRPVSASWTTWLRRPSPPDSRAGRRARRAWRCRLASMWPPTGSCKRLHQRTQARPCITRRSRRSLPPRPGESEVIDDGRGQASEHAAGTASSACASGWRSMAVTSKSVPGRTAGSASPRRCQTPVRARDHQRRRRR